MKSPNPATTSRRSLFGEPLLVTRGDVEEIRVLSNLCRHRGMLLAEGAGSTRRFVCSYHAWTYGSLRPVLNAPRMSDKGVTDKTCSAIPSKLEVWNGFIYANLDPEACPLAPRVWGARSCSKSTKPTK